MEGLGADVTVILEDKIDLNQLQLFDAVILSPGPGLPSEKKNLFEILELCQGKIPVLGICLGMQGIAEFLGMKLENQEQVKHGVSETINVFNHHGLFQGLPNNIEVGLYHSWKVVSNSKEHFTAISQNGVNMALEIPQKKLFGVQFHPESIMTPTGKEILKNFLFNMNH